jgi:hypothetical protein
VDHDRRRGIDSAGIGSLLRDSLLAQTQGNVEVWMHAFETMHGEELLCAEYLFENIPRLDRLEMTWKPSRTTYWGPRGEERLLPRGFSA